MILLDIIRSFFHKPENKWKNGCEFEWVVYDGIVKHYCRQPYIEKLAAEIAECGKLPGVRTFFGNTYCECTKYAKQNATNE
jgi:hypothetical protein